jgi:phosphoribosylaminoimidazole carboxylase PurE protein
MSKQIAILMGSDSDLAVMEEAVKMLKQFEVGFEIHILSAHRTPAEVMRYVKEAPEKGIKVFIAGAGGAAHLAGMIAAHTLLPVIGVPIDSSPFHGLDSLLSTVQMPKGVPVATVGAGRGGAGNAALLAIEILALSEKRLAGQLQNYRKTMSEEVARKDAELQKKI